MNPSAKNAHASPFPLSNEPCTKAASPGAESAIASALQLRKCIPRLARCETGIRDAETTEAPAREMIELASELAQVHRTAGPLAKRSCYLVRVRRR